MSFHVILFEPEIPPNTGNVIRLCANVGAQLHLVQPLGFELDNAKLKRAGLDYHDLTRVHVHASLSACLDACPGGQRWAFSTKASRAYSAARFAADDILLFGPETRGLPADVLSGFSAETLLRIPMRAGSRSLNLSNAVAVAVYEAWRQLGFQSGS